MAGADEDLPPELHEALRRDIHTVIRRRSGRRRVLGAAAIGVTALSLMGAAWVVILPPGVRERRAVCYEAADLQARSVTSQYSFDDELANPEGAAIENCELLWQNGLLTNDELGSGAEPPLVLCTAQDLSFQVFPRAHADARSTAEFCDDLGFIHSQRD